MRVLPATTTADANQVVITLSSRNAMVELRMEPTAIVLGRTLTLLRRLQHGMDFLIFHIIFTCVESSR